MLAELMFSVIERELVESAFLNLATVDVLQISTFEHHLSHRHLPQRSCQEPQAPDEQRDKKKLPDSDAAFLTNPVAKIGKNEQFFVLMLNMLFFVAQIGTVRFLSRFKMANF